MYKGYNMWEEFTNGLANMFSNDKATSTNKQVAKDKPWLYTGIGLDGNALTSSTMVDAAGNSLFKDGSVTNATQSMTGDGLFGMSNGTMSGLAGIGQLGLGLLSYSESKKNNQIKRNLANQEYATNAVHEANLQSDRRHLQGLGL